MSTEATNREAAVALAEALGNLPLALEQAAAYTSQAGITLSDYLELFRARAAAYVPPASPSADYPDALAVTFDIALSRLREESPAAAELLTLCAFLAPDDVPLESFRGAAEALKLPDVDVANPEVLLAQATQLQSYSLVKLRGGSFLSVHRLTQAIARDRLAEDERKRWALGAVVLMQAAFPFNVEDTRTWPPSARVLQHALIAAVHAKALGVGRENAAVLLNNIGLYLLNNAELAEAKAALEKSIELCEELFGPSHPELALRLNNIGETLRRQGNLGEAAEYLNRALVIDEAALGHEHPNVAVRLNNIGEVLRERGDYDDARGHYERALAIFETAFGPEHASVATILNNIGLVLSAQDDPKGACDYYRRALLIDEKVYGPDHPNVAINLTNLGSVLAKLGDADAAREYLERAQNIFHEHLGDSHPWTLLAKQHLVELDYNAADESSSE